ncbi:hypothetical protein AB0J86_05650 [Micromonospora sp. NPDC049559]|uniref:hypothetical protein n=1 Tax=Micromonospora sp. NPDC049559 TaxID=3155923 RepID=UPI00342298D3
MQDAWRAYLELALGFTEASRKRAQSVARRVVESGGATAVQLQALAEELRSTSLANREALTKIVRFEVDRALGAVGLATADEVADLTARVRQLEQELRESRWSAPAAEAAAGGTAAGPSEAGVARGLGPDEAVAKKAAAKKAVAKKTAAKKALARVEPAKKAVAKRTEPAKKTAPAKKMAKKTAARKPPPAAGTESA